MRIPKDCVKRSDPRVVWGVTDVRRPDQELAAEVS